MRLAYWDMCRSIRMRESISGSLAYTTETLQKHLYYDTNSNCKIWDWYLSIYKDERINLRQPGLHNRNTSQIKTHKLIQQMMKESISPFQLFQFPFTIIQTEMSVCKWLEVLLMTSNCVRLPLSSVPASKGFIFLQLLIDIDNKDK